MRVSYLNLGYLVPSNLAELVWPLSIFIWFCTLLVLLTLGHCHVSHSAQSLWPFPRFLSSYDPVLVLKGLNPEPVCLLKIRINLRTIYFGYFSLKIVKLMNLHTGDVGRTCRIWRKYSSPLVPAFNQIRNGIWCPKMGSQSPTPMWMPSNSYVFRGSITRPYW